MDESAILLAVEDLSKICLLSAWAGLSWRRERKGESTDRHVSTFRGMGKPLERIFYFVLAVGMGSVYYASQEAWFTVEAREASEHSRKTATLLGYHKAHQN